MENLKDEVFNEVTWKVHNQVFDEVYVRVYDEVYNEVYDKVNNNSISLARQSFIKAKLLCKI